MKANLLRYSALVFWRVTMLWWWATMFFTRKHGHTVPRASSIPEILQRLNFGNDYKPDPWKGKLDVLRHPRTVQRWIDTGKGVGDCDEHAAYWCCVLLKSGLASNAWLCTLQMQSIRDGSLSGHAVCVFRDMRGDLYYVDYSDPIPLSNLWQFAIVSAGIYGAKPIFGTAVLVKLGKHDALHWLRGHARVYKG